MSIIQSEQLAVAGTASLKTAKAWIDFSLDSSERFIYHHLSSSRDSLLAQFDHVHSLLGSKDWQSLQASSSPALQRQNEQFIAYQRRLYEISSSTVESYQKLLQQGLQQFTQWLPANIRQHLPGEVSNDGSLNQSAQGETSAQRKKSA